jgi:hypothetical protein
MIDKYALYQVAVQDAEGDVDLYLRLFKKVRPHFKPLVLREDFCAAFAFSCAWAKKNKKHLAYCLDIDPEPLAWGKEHNFSKLKPSEKSRVQVFEQNVISHTTPLADLIMTGNFSFYVLKDRRTLVRYFKAAHASLSRDGLFFLEMAGGPDFITKGKEKRVVRDKRTGTFTYIWDQKAFDPITREGLYAIHFQVPQKGRKTPRMIRNAFTYDWRLWTIPEVRDALAEAGFRHSSVLWEKVVRGKETGDYTVAHKAQNTEFWLGYVVGEK